MKQYTVEQLSGVVDNSDTEVEAESEIDESGSEIKKDPKFPLPRISSPPITSSMQANTITTEYKR